MNQEVENSHFEVILREACGEESVPDCGPAVLARLSQRDPSRTSKHSSRQASTPGATRRPIAVVAQWLLVACAVVVVTLLWVVSDRDQAPGQPEDRGAAATQQGIRDKGKDQDKAKRGAGVIAGRCLDADGKPIAKVKVDLFHQDYRKDRTRLVRSGVTDAEGAFRIDGIALVDPSQYSYEFHFVIATSPNHAVGVATLRDEKIELDKLALTMGPPAEVRGTVRDRSGDPVAGARVRVMMIGEHDNPDYRRIWLSEPNVLLQTKSDAKGQFVLPRLPADRHLVLGAESSQHAPERVTCTAPGEIEFRLASGAVVTGRVLGPDGKPVPFAKVSAQGTRESGWATAKTDANGAFEIRSLAKDGYNIWVDKEGFTAKAIDSLEVESGQKKKAPDLKLILGGIIRGRVVDRQGQPFRPTDGEVIALYGPARPRSGAAVQTAPIQKDGTFSIRTAPGKVYIYVMATRRGAGPGRSRGVNIELRDGQTVEVQIVN